MENLITLVLVLTPLFIGYFIRLPKPYLPVLDRLLSVLVYIILILIGISLSQVPNLGEQTIFIFSMASLLFIGTTLFNLIFIILWEHCYPWQVQTASSKKKAKVSISGSVKQISCVLLGVLLGKTLQENYLPSNHAGTVALMLLILLVGMQLGSSGIALKNVLINRRGVWLSIHIMLSALLGGLLFSWIVPNVSMGQGLALASGFGWYSLTGIVITEAYGAVWGSVALVNDLAREFFALAFIPLIMKRYPSAAVGVGGATSLDFTLPIIQSSGGLAVVPLAISFGFIINLLAPFLMILFSSLS